MLAPGRLIPTRAVVRGGMLLVGAVLIAVAAPLLIGAHDAGDLLRFAAVVLAYGVFWIALTSLINLFVRASTTAALASGTAWLAIVVLLPARSPRRHTFCAGTVGHGVRQRCHPYRAFPKGIPLAPEGRAPNPL